MVGDRLPFKKCRAGRLAEPDELRRDNPTLVHQLVEGMLSVCSGLAEDDFLGEYRCGDCIHTVESNVRNKDLEMASQHEHVLCMYTLMSGGPIGYWFD